MLDINTKKGALLFLVQNWFLMAGASRSNDPLLSAQTANKCLSGILVLGESMIPRDVEKACEDLMLFIEGRQDPSNRPYPCPDWFESVHMAQERFFNWEMTGYPS